MPTLVVIHGQERGRRYTLDQPIIRIGRDSSNNIRVPDHEISRHHAEIRSENGQFKVVDLVSSNGTFVNGRRVTEAVLESGDRVQCGQTVWLFGTGANVSRGDLAKKINMITRAATDRSSIVKAFSQAEGNQFIKRLDRPEEPWVHNALAHLRVLYETSRAASHIVDQHVLLKRILELTFESVEADRGCVLLLDDVAKHHEVAAVHYRSGVNAEEQIEISRTIVDYVQAKGEGVRTSDAAADERFTPGQSIMNQGIREAICVPMQGRHSLLGVIYLDIRTTPEQLALQENPTSRFTDEQLKLLIAIGHQAALAIEDTRYYQAMIQSERLAAVGQTIATLSHDIKNILQGIKGGSHLIEMGLSGRDEDQVRRGWKIVNKNQNKIYNLVLDMLTFSKEREPMLETSDLNEVVAEVVELMESRAQEIGVQLQSTLDAAMPRMAIDPEAIHRAVLNIVTNAIDATEEKEGGGVHVRTQFDAAKSTARVLIRDNGVGIPPEELAQLFTLFVSTKGARGTGIGLPVSEKIVREHGGRIHVESQPGRGTEFIIELPVRADQQTIA